MSSNGINYKWLCSTKVTDTVLRPKLILSWVGSPLFIDIYKCMFIARSSKLLGNELNLWKLSFKWFDRERKRESFPNEKGFKSIGLHKKYRYCRDNYHMNIYLSVYSSLTENHKKNVKLYSKALLPVEIDSIWYWFSTWKGPSNVLDLNIVNILKY